jgi:hypothetical protein
MPNEFAAWGVYDERTRALRYRPLIASMLEPGGIEFHRPRARGRTSTWRSTCTRTARSPRSSPSTDDEDDAGEVKLSVVAGGSTASRNGRPPLPARPFHRPGVRGE